MRSKRKSSRAIKRRSPFLTSPWIIDRWFNPRTSVLSHLNQKLASGDITLRVDQFRDLASKQLRCMCSALCRPLLGPSTQGTPAVPYASLELVGAILRTSVLSHLNQSLASGDSTLRVELLWISLEKSVPASHSVDFSDETPKRSKAPGSACQVAPRAVQGKGGLSTSFRPFQAWELPSLGRQHTMINTTPTNNTPNSKHQGRGERGETTQIAKFDIPQRTTDTAHDAHHSGRGERGETVESGVIGCRVDPDVCADPTCARESNGGCVGRVDPDVCADPTCARESNGGCVGRVDPDVCADPTCALEAACVVESRDDAQGRVCAQRARESAACRLDEGSGVKPRQRAGRIDPMASKAATVPAWTMLRAFRVRYRLRSRMGRTLARLACRPLRDLRRPLPLADGSADGWKPRESRTSETG
jgi:hypothetical protein